MPPRRLIAWDPAITGPAGIREYEIVVYGGLKSDDITVRPVVTDDEVAAQNKLMRKWLVKVGVPKYTVYPNRVINLERPEHGEVRLSDGKSYKNAIAVTCIAQEPKIHYQYIVLGKLRSRPPVQSVLVNDVYVNFTMDDDIICFDRPLQYVENMGPDMIRIVVVFEE